MQSGERLADGLMRQAVFSAAGLCCAHMRAHILSTACLNSLHTSLSRYHAYIILLVFLSVAQTAGWHPVLQVCSGGALWLVPIPSQQGSKDTCRDRSCYRADHHVLNRCLFVHICLVGAAWQYLTRLFHTELSESAEWGVFYACMPFACCSRQLLPAFPCLHHFVVQP